MLDLDGKVRINPNIKFRNNEEKTMIINPDNSQCFLISNECIDIIYKAINERMTYKELIGCIEEKESKDYMLLLLNQLNDRYMLWYSNCDKIKGNQLNISVDITNSCNLRCKHCCIEAGDEKRGGDLSTNDMISILNKIIKIKPYEISISGGEPLLRKDFRQLTDYIRTNYRGYLTIMTNATLINENTASYLVKNYDKIDVSLDGIDEETSSILRGPGVFEKAIRGIKMLTARGGNVVASMVLTRDTLHLGKKFIDFCNDELKIRGILRGFEPIGRGKTNIDDFKVEGLSDGCNKNFERRDIKYSNISIDKLQVYACQGARRVFQIGHNGDIFPCPSMMYNEMVMGNVLKIDDLEKYILDGEYKCTVGYERFSNFKPYKLKKCKDCKNNLFCFNCVNQVKICCEQDDLEIVCKNNINYYESVWKEGSN